MRWSWNRDYLGLCFLLERLFKFLEMETYWLGNYSIAFSGFLYVLLCFGWTFLLFIYIFRRKKLGICPEVLVVFGRIVVLSGPDFNSAAHFNDRWEICILTQANCNMFKCYFTGESPCYNTATYNSISSNRGRIGWKQFRQSFRN